MGRHAASARLSADRDTKRRNKAWAIRERTRSMYERAQQHLMVAPEVAREAYLAMLETQVMYHAVTDRNVPLIDALIGNSDADDQRAELVQEVNDARERFNKTSRRFARAVSDEELWRKLVASRLLSYEEADRHYHAIKGQQWRSVINAQRTASEGQNVIDQADIPQDYRSAVRIVVDARGSINVYFGGYKRPDGPGHGHSVIDKSGKMSYYRPPGNDHGSNNFIKP